MKIKKSQLRKIILESLIVEAISVEQAEAKLEKEKMKIWKSLIFVVKRDGIGAIRSAAQKYNYKPSPWTDGWDESPLKTTHLDGASYGLEHLTADELFRNIDNFIPVDVDDADRSNSILWLIKQFKSDLGLFFAVTEEEEVIENNYGNLGEVTLVNKIRNSLEKFGQFKHLLNPAEKRDLFRIKDMQELFSIIEAHEEVIDAENKRLGSRISGENVIKGFIPLRGGLNIVGGNTIQKNSQTGFYTKPDSEGVVIGEIHTKAAAVKLGSDTEWCTAAPGLNYFHDYYESDDPLIYIEIGGTRWQFSYSSHQFMDEGDNPIQKEKEIELSRLVWRELRQKYGEAILNKYPKITTWMIANNVASDFSDEAIMTIINNENIDVDVLNAFAINPNTPIEGLKKISQNFAWGSAVLNNPALTQEIVDHFVKYHIERENLGGQKILALINLTNLDTPKEVFALNDNYVFDALTAKKDLTPEIIEHVLENGYDKNINALLKNKNLKPEFLKFIYDSGKLKGLSKFAILQNPSTPESVLRSAYERGPYFHQSISANINTPSDILADIANHSKTKFNKTVVYNIINSPNLTKSILDLYIGRMINGELLASERQLSSRIAVFIVKNSPLVTKSDIAKIKDWNPETGSKLERFWNKNNPDDQIIQSSENDQNLGMVSERWLQIAGLTE